MSETMTTALVAVRERLNESSATHWTQPELRRWIQAGMKEMAKRTEYLRDRATITAVAGTQEYAIATNVIRVHRCEYTPTGANQPVYTLEYRDWNAMDAVWWSSQTTTQARPLLWTMWGYPPALKLVVYPKPDLAGTFKLFVYRYPAALDLAGSQDTTTLEMPEGWEEAVFDYCEYMALRKDRDPRWQEAKQLFEEKISDLYDISRRYSDQSGMIVGQTSLVPQWLYDDGGY